MLSDAIGAAPLEPRGFLEPFGVLHDHRGAHHRERLVGDEDPVASGEQIALEPALAQVLAQHLHHASRRRDVIVDRDAAPDEAAFSTSNTARQPIRVGFVGTEEAEVGCFAVVDVHVAQKVAELARGFAPNGRGCGHLDRVLADVTESPMGANHVRRSRADSRPCVVRPAAQAPRVPAPSVRRGRTANSGR